MGISHNVLLEHQAGPADEAIKFLVLAGLIIVIELDPHTRSGFIQGIESAQRIAQVVPRGGASVMDAGAGRECI